MELSQDRFLDGRLVVEQPVHGYRAAMDPVLMAAAVPVMKAESHLLEIGAGVGVASLCYAARCPGGRVTGLEIQPDYVEIAVRNARRNGFEQRVSFVQGDLLSPPGKIFQAHHFDQVMANPPFLTADQAVNSPVQSRNIANVEGKARLADWISFALKMLKPKGGLTLIHRADRIDEILALLHDRAGDISLFPFWPFAGQPAKRVLVRARKSVRGAARIHAGLILHSDKAQYTSAARSVLKDGQGLTFSQL